MHSKKLFRKLPIPAAVSAALISVSSSAQMMEEVVVTAQKRQQSVQDVGITINAFSGETLEAMGLTSSNEVGAITPNLEIRSPAGEGGVVTIFIRGVGLNDFAINNSGPVGFYIDDVYAGSSNAQVSTMFDVERVEVLKGPQGTLFGRNTTGGAIHILSRRPTEETEGFAKLTVGQWDNTDENLYKLEGAVSGSLGDNLKARLAFVQAESNGFMTNSHTGDGVEKKNQAARLQVDWQASETVNLLFNLNGSRNDSDADLYGTTVDKEFYESPSSSNIFLDVEQFGASVKLTWDVNDSMTFTSITGYQDMDKEHIEDADMNAFVGIEPFYAPETELFSQEFQLSGKTERLNWIAGLYYMQEKNDFSLNLFTNELLTGLYAVTPDMCDEGSPSSDPVGCYYFTIFDGGFGTFTYDNEQKLETVALFGQTEVELNDQFTLTVGARYTDVSTDFQNNTLLYENGSLYIQGALGIGAQGLPWSTPKLNQDQGASSGKLALNYYANEDIMLYGSVSRGFKSGGFNGNFYFNPEGYYSDADQNLGLGLAPQSPEYDDETLTAYELGLKSTLLNGDMTFNAAVFFYDYQDAQIFNNLTDPIFGLPSQSISNAKEMEMWGLDVDVVWHPADGLTLRGAVGYLDSEFVEASLFDSLGNEAVLDGERPQNSPEWSASLLAHYEWSFGGGTMTAQADMSYTDEILFSNGLLVDDGQGGLVYDRNGQLGEDAVTLWNARLSWRSSANTIEVAAWGRNITDEEYRSNMFELTDTIGADQVLRGTPRSFGFDVSYHF